MPVDVNRARDLFVEAVGKLQPDQWEAFLAEKCGADAELLRHLKHLLQVHVEAGSFLESPAAALPPNLSPSPPPRSEEGEGGRGTAPTLDDAITERPGTVIGPYKLLEQIGEGGFGVVFMAEQQEPIRRKVALKVLKPGMDTRHVIGRFEAERQALAIMDHPNIAKVHDGGATPSGRPYFVMELVRGVPVTDYCDQNQLTPRERLELFIPICQAVQHAHQKGIIHRDVKPSNVLVTERDGQPVPKVIDFGIAKALGQRLTDKTLFTGFAQMLGTPLYMSPEQAGLTEHDVDTRSDVYSLGVLLYELLTGATPFDKERLKDASYEEVRRIIREEEPPKPSTRLSTLGQAASTVCANRRSDPRRLGQLFRGELDWIVMKALEKDRNRRYETANGFAMDVQRYLADEAVLACPPSAWYRLRKFVRRNKGPVWAASLVFLALVGGVIGTTSGLVRAEHALQGEEEQRLAAEANADRAAKAQERAEQGFAKAKEAVEHYLKAVTDDPDLKHKHDLHALRKRLLEAAVPFYQWFTEQKPSEAALEAERGRAYSRLAFVRAELGEMEAARKDYERMQAIFAQLAADFPSVPEYRLELATSHNNLGILLKDQGQGPAAEQAFRRALDLQETLAADFPSVPEYRLELATSHNNLGILLKSLGQGPAAEQAYRRALDIQEKLAADFPGVPASRQYLARSHNNLGILLAELGQGPAAEQAYRRALDIKETLAADFPSVPEYRQELARSHNNLGILLMDQGQRPAAEQDFRRALDLQEQLAADFPAVPEYRRDLAKSHLNLGILLRNLGRRPAAVQAYRRALDLQDTLAADFPTVPAYRLELANSHDTLAVLLADLGQRPEAERAYRRALDLYQTLVSGFPAVPAYRRELAGSSVNFGRLLRDQGQAEASLAWFAKAIALLEPLVQQEPRLVTERLFLRNAHWSRADALDKLGRHADAVKHWDRALELNALPGHEPGIRSSRALSLARTGEHAKAVAEANALAAAKDVDSAKLYNLACVCAVAAAAVKGDAKLQDQYAASAVELLRQAVAKGYKDATHMKKEKDFDVLRDREDFKKLVAELEAKKE